MTTRRRFLQTTGLLTASLAAGGCDVSAAEADASATSPVDVDALLLDPSAGAADIVSHTMARLSYGVRPADVARVRAVHGDANLAAAHYVNEQLAYRHIDHAADRAVRRLEALAEPLGELYEYQPDLLRQQLASATLLRAVYGERQLFEVMVGFWTDHFNIDLSKGDCRWLLAAHDRDVIRAHALGSFPDLLRAVVLSPAMLWYLDGRVNRRANADELPNENYARELLELHTLGVDGGYDQTDVMEVARALSGWSVRSRDASHFGIGAVEFTAAHHDTGAKRILGHTISPGGGARDVQRVIEIVTTHPSCARFIATKLCRRFIDDEPPAAAVRAVASTFSATRGDITACLRTLIECDAFRNARGSRLKRPFHFVASALRVTGAATDGGPDITQWLERMGHAPFQYPTPDGYPNDAGPWLGTLLWRWQFAAALVEGRIHGTSLPDTHKTLLLALSSPAFQRT